MKRSFINCPYYMMKNHPEQLKSIANRLSEREILKLLDGWPDIIHLIDNPTDSMFIEYAKGLMFIYRLKNDCLTENDYKYNKWADDVLISTYQNIDVDNWNKLAKKSNIYDYPSVVQKIEMILIYDMYIKEAIKNNVFHLLPALRYKSPIPIHCSKLWLCWDLPNYPSFNSDYDVVFQWCL